MEDSKILEVMQKARFHLPGLFEFHDFYEIFLDLFSRHRDWFYDWCEIGSIYGAPASCLWGGGRVGFGQSGIEQQVLVMARKFGVPVRLTFSNSLLQEKHLDDAQCNRLCRLFESPENGVIVHSDILLEYLRAKYPKFQLISSTTKVITDFDQFKAELERPEFSYVVPDFRLNHRGAELGLLPQDLKSKVEFLCNECCWFECQNRKQCYENVSRKALGEAVTDWNCNSPGSENGYVFSKAMKNPGFISLDDIRNNYLPAGFTNFKIEGRSLGSALILEFLLYYMTKPEHALEVRENIYLDNTLDLF